MQSLVSPRFSQLFQRRPSGSARHGIAGQRAAQKAVRAMSFLARIGKLQQFPFSNDRRKRVASADYFAVASQIWDDAVALLRAAPGDSKTRDDLVEDQHDAIALRNLT